MHKFVNTTDVFTKNKILIFAFQGVNKKFRKNYEKNFNASTKTIVSLLTFATVCYIIKGDYLKELELIYEPEKIRRR